MKYFLLLGGFCGFALAFFASFQVGNSPGCALRDGAVGCLASALLWRGLYAVLLGTIRSQAQVALATVPVQTPAETSSRDVR